MSHAKHFIRLLVVIAIMAVAFLQVRAMVVPQDFGKLGTSEHPPSPKLPPVNRDTAGSAECSDCHSEINEAGKAESLHPAVRRTATAWIPPREGRERGLVDLPTY
jgi:hypothetical protein